MDIIGQCKTFQVQIMHSQGPNIILFIQHCNVYKFTISRIDNSINSCISMVEMNKWSELVQNTPIHLIYQITHYRLTLHSLIIAISFIHRFTFSSSSLYLFYGLPKGKVFCFSMNTEFLLIEVGIIVRQNDWKSWGGWEDCEKDTCTWCMYLTVFLHVAAQCARKYMRYHSNCVVF